MPGGFADMLRQQLLSFETFYTADWREFKRWSFQSAGNTFFNDIRINSANKGLRFEKTFKTWTKTQKKKVEDNKIFGLKNRA